jgi:RimJ/RimL family protein N-acetyltransferase
MSGWPRFADPLYQLFDWPKRSEVSDDLWFRQLMRDSSRVYYAVDNQVRELIGRISLREIRGRKSARLGIGFGPDYVDQGYGTEALSLFLDHFFNDLGFERMVLDVAAVNQRALRCYKRCGFRSVASHYQYAGGASEVQFLQHEDYRDLRRYFRRERHRTTMLAYDMELAREDWLVLREET